MNIRRGTLRLTAMCLSTALFGACALMRPDEPVTVRWPNALLGSWEAREPDGDDFVVWILSENGGLRGFEVDQDGRERGTWNGSWWTQPAGDDGARELCTAVRHGRGAWCEDYTISTDPRVLIVGEQEFRPR